MMQNAAKLQRLWHCANDPTLKLQQLQELPSPLQPQLQLGAKSKGGILELLVPRRAATGTTTEWSTNSLFLTLCDRTGQVLKSNAGPTQTTNTWATESTLLRLTVVQKMPLLRMSFTPKAKNLQTGQFGWVGGDRASRVIGRGFMMPPTTLLRTRSRQKSRLVTQNGGLASHPTWSTSHHNC